MTDLPQSPRRVLIVDDTPTVLRTTVEHFKNLGYEVHEVVDGVFALEALKKHGPFDVLATDDDMPNMSGRQLLEEIKDLYPHMLRILLSGRTTEQEAMEAGADGFLRKPYRKHELLALLGQPKPEPPA